MIEQTLVLLKPDATERHLTETILDIYKQQGWHIVEQKTLQANRQQIEALYADHATQDFFPNLCAYMVCASIVAVLLEGEDIIQKVRVLHGATNPTMAAVGTIRHTYGLSQRFNTVHSSADSTAAKREIAIFF